MLRNLYYIILSFFAASCSPNNVTIDEDIKRFFDETKTDGCFALIDNKSGEFTMYNLDWYRDSAFQPASTFKIVNSLIGLQTGRIVNDQMIIPWDGVTRPVAEWNRDLTMYDAFRVSSVGYYQEVARRIGKDTMQKWLDTLSYGTKVIKTRIDSFWLDNSLKITPDEQLGFVKRLYFKQLPFFPNNQETVKKAMLFEDRPEYKLSYKTGWGFADSARTRNIGWIVGWIEENNHPYFFVLNLESKEKNFDMVSVRMKILKGILDHLGFLKGKK